MPHLALYTFGTLKSPLTDPALLTREFHESGGAVYGKVGQQPGYIARAQAADRSLGAQTDFDSDWGEWGEFAVPAWFERTGHPGHVLWWVTEGTIPTWQDGVARLEHLHEHGLAPRAFTFHHPFNPDGTPT